MRCILLFCLERGVHACLWQLAGLLLTSLMQLLISSRGSVRLASVSLLHGDAGRDSCWLLQYSRLLSTESGPLGCCSLDILRDELGGPRNAFPHTMYMVAGTQAASAKRNYLALIKLSDINQGRHGAKAGAADDSGDDLLSDSDEEVEEPPQMHLRMQVSSDHS